MTEAQRILEMIEKVDVDDKGALRLIDTHVFAFIKFHEDGLTVHIKNGSIYHRHESWPKDVPMNLYHLFDKHNYTTSRDALKSIRPDGWTFSLTCNSRLFDDWSCDGENFKSLSRDFSVRRIKTEELAELHAIIQAIQWERELNDKRN